MVAFFTDTTVPRRRLELDSLDPCFKRDMFNGVESKVIGVTVWPDIIEPISSYAGRCWVELNMRFTTDGFIALTPLIILSEHQKTSFLERVNNWKQPVFDELDKLNKLLYDPPENLHATYFIKCTIVAVLSKGVFVHYHEDSDRSMIKNLELVVMDHSKNKMLVNIDRNLVGFLGIKVYPHWDLKDLDSAICSKVSNLVDDTKEYQILVRLVHICDGVYKWFVHQQ